MPRSLPLLPPGPPNGRFGMAHTGAMRDDLIGFCKRLQRDHGDVSHFRLGPLDCYQFLHPDQIHEVLVRKAGSFQKQGRLKQVFGRFEGNGLVVSDGEVWRRHRQLVQPAFTPQHLVGHAAIVAQCVEQFLQHFTNTMVVDISSALRRLMLQIVTRALFSADVDDALESIAEAVDEIQAWSMREMHRIVATPCWLPLWGQPRARRAIRVLHSQVRRIIQQRRDRLRLAQRDPNASADLLDNLLVADPRVPVALTDRELQDEIVTLLLAGFETSAAAVTWATWLLATYPEIQQETADQVRGVLGTRTPGFSDLPRLAMVERVFREAMRLYPPVYFLSREVVETVEIGDYQLPPSSQVFLVPYLTHHDPRWFPEPEKFDPSRFAAGLESRLPACVYFPFGAGPRACVGKGLAILEGTLVLAALLQRFRLEPAPNQGVPELAWQLSLHPKENLRLTLTCRG